MSDLPASLRQQLMQFPVPRRYCVAFSGGCDSHVLLHALSVIRQQLACTNIQAIHIHHGLQADADYWAKHCGHICHELDVSYRTIRVSIPVGNNASIEALARTARYDAFSRLQETGDMLLLAHHQDDQAETVMLQLLRGAGVNGLAAMPDITEFGQGWIARPLLHKSRKEIQDYAEQHQLDWIDDPSNADTSFDRNFLRHQIFPVLKNRWPSAQITIARAAQHQAEAAKLNYLLAEEDLSQVACHERNTIIISRLETFSRERQANIIRFWIKHVRKLPLPDTSQLEQILTNAVGAGRDKEPLVTWHGVEVRRYRDELFVQSPLASHDTNWEVQWDYGTGLVLPTGGSLVGSACHGAGIPTELLGETVTVRFRRGGEACRLPGRKHRHDLKKLFQEWGVPPWQRNRVPLVFIGDDMAQIVGYSLCDPYVASPGESGIEFKFKA